jgi:Zn-dependent protease with chaperone function
MAFQHRRILHAVIALSVLLLLCFARSIAAETRPNEIDRRVDAIPVSALLTQPATQLVDPDRQAAARRLVGLTLPGWILMALFEAAALAYFWSSGGAAMLRDRLRRHVRSEWTVRFAFGAVLALIARAAAILPAFYLYRVERVMGLSDELTGTWFALWVGHTILGMITAGVIAAFVLWLVERTHQWYVFTILAILGASVAWAMVNPFFAVPGSRAMEPISGALGDRLHALTDRAGLPDMRVDVHKTPNSPNDRAIVMGLGSSRHVVLSSTLVAASTPEEVLYQAAFAIGEVVLGNPVFVALIEGGIIIVFSALAVTVADRIGFRRDDDPLSRFALVGALLAIVYLAAVPVRNSSLRSYDTDADRYAVALTGNKAAAIRAIVRAADQHLIEVCPEALPASFLYDHPSPARRVSLINGVPSGCP